MKIYPSKISSCTVCMLQYCCTNFSVVYIIEEDLGKVNYCLTILKPKYYPADEYIRIYCILHFNLEGSKRVRKAPSSFLHYAHALYAYFMVACPGTDSRRLHVT